MQIIFGTKDKIEREVVPVKEPAIPRKKFGVDEIDVGYTICQVEVTPNKYATQLVRTSRIEHKKSE